MAHVIGHDLGIDCHGNRALAGRSSHSNVPRWLDHALSRIRLWSERSRQRQALLELDGRQLSDIGITREAAEREASKPFWA